jgi:prolyl oligopeptidase
MHVRVMGNSFLAALLPAALLAQAVPRTAKPAYPPARKDAVVDDYHGTKVPDPYRWLEDADHPDTVKWVDAQNALTRSYVDGPPREAIKARLTELFDYARVGLPERQGNRYFYTRNTGLQNQSVLYVREGLKGTERVLLDPNTLSPDGTVALTSTYPTQDGTLLGYSLSRSGSDRQELLVRTVSTGVDLPDRVQTKFTAITWTPDNKGFYYTRFPQPGSVPKEDENYYGKVYYHRLGEPQDKDELVFERPDKRELFPAASLTLDGRFLVLAGYEGSSDRTEVHVLDRSKPGARPELLFKGFDHAWGYVGDLDGRLFFTTDKEAPLGRLVSVDYAKGARDVVAVIPEGKDKLSLVAVVNRQLVVSRLRNAADLVTLHAVDGKELKQIALPGIGSVAGITGDPDDGEMLLSFTSFTYPTTPYRYDFAGGRLDTFAGPVGEVDSAAFEVKQVWAPSKDGTRIPMFLVHKKGLALDGARPTLLSGYGGFNVNVTPAFGASKILWLERGGVVASVNLRGGGEFGEAWHKAGMLDRKQNVFDDFIAAAEWLIANKYTRASKLAIQGGSNGGLLVGAAMIQRPDLFGAVVCQVPVADMLRYHLFTVGRFWIPEYGSSEDPKQFEFLYRYSPLHTVKDGVAYPATLVTTADTDDRVAPGLAKKFAARLQEASGGPAPILLRVETKAGHGAGKPVSKQIDETADVYAFLSRVLGLEG